MQGYDLDALITELDRYADERYRLFNESLTPGTEGRSIGVRMPVVRRIARGILTDDPEAFLNVSLHSDIHEIQLLHAIVLAGMRCPLRDRLERLSAFVPTIGNWAVCDLLCNDLRLPPDDLPAFWYFLQDYLRSNREFEVRFAVVMLMLRFSSDEWIDRTLSAYSDFHHEGYYARMGAAWGLSMLFVRQRERTLDFLSRNLLDKTTHNMAIRKIIESRQVSPEDKRLIRTLKRPES